MMSGSPSQDGAVRIDVPADKSCREDHYEPLETELERHYCSGNWDGLRKQTSDQLVQQPEHPGDAAWLLYYYACSDWRNSWTAKTVERLERAIVLNQRGYCSMILLTLINCALADTWRREGNFDRARQPLTHVGGVIGIAHTRQSELLARVLIARGRIAYREALHYRSLGDIDDGEYAKRADQLLREAQTCFGAAGNTPTPDWSFWQQYATYYQICLQGQTNPSQLTKTSWRVLGYADNPVLGRSAGNFYVLNREVRQYLDEPSAEQLAIVLDRLNVW
jgi:hypothetical protein